MECGFFLGAEKKRSLKPITRIEPGGEGEPSRADSSVSEAAGRRQWKRARRARHRMDRGEASCCCSDRRPGSALPCQRRQPAALQSTQPSALCVVTSCRSRQPHPSSPLCRECRRILRPTPHCRCRPVVTSESTSAIRPSSSTHSMSRRPWSVAAMTMESERAMGQLIECAHMRVGIWRSRRCVRTERSNASPLTLRCPAVCAAPLLCARSTCWIRATWRTFVCRI